MPDFQIRFDVTFPEDLKQRTETLLLRFLPFACRRVDRLFVIANDRQDYEAAIDIRARYRHANVLLTGEFFRSTDEEQVEYVAHEIAHILVEPLGRQARIVAEAYVPKDSLDYVQQQLEDAEELAVEEMTRAMVELTQPTRANGRVLRKT